MSLWTTSTTGLETALAAAIGTTIQQHSTINNNLKGPSHIVHIGNGTSNNNGSHPNHHINLAGHHNQQQQQQPHHHLNHHNSSHSFYHNNSNHNSNNNLQQAIWNRNTICSNHQKVRIFYFYFQKTILAKISNAK